jgi:hypothetical protein
MVHWWVLVHYGPKKSQKLLGLKLHIVALLILVTKVKYLESKLNAHKTRGRLGLTQEIAKSCERPKKKKKKKSLLLTYSWSFRCSTGERRSVSCTCIPIISIPVSLADRPGESKHKSSKQTEEDIALHLLSIAHVHHHHNGFFSSDQFCVVLNNVQFQVPANSIP